MTEEQLNEIKARLAAAYKGEAWYYSPINEDVCYLDNNMDEMAVADVRSQEAGEFIASAPADIDADTAHCGTL